MFRWYSFFVAVALLATCANVYGQSALELELSHSVWGSQENQHFGDALYAVDMNGDGYKDLIVGASGTVLGDNVNAGQIYMMLTPFNPLDTEIFFGLSGPATGFEGASVPNSGPIIQGAGAGELVGGKFEIGDLNGDGEFDIVLANSAEADGGLVKKVHVFFGPFVPGSPVSTNAANVVLSGEAGDDFGSDIAIAPDWNNDGINELVIGAARSANFTGKVYVYNDIQGSAEYGISDADMVFSSSRSFGLFA